MRRFLPVFLFSLGAFFMGVASTYYVVVVRYLPGYGDMVLNELSSPLGELYTAQGDPRPSEDTLDMLRVKMAGAVLLATTSSGRMKDPLSEDRLDRHINLILDRDLLKDVKSIDARASAYSAAQCWRDREGDIDKFYECASAEIGLDSHPSQAIKTALVH